MIASELDGADRTKPPADLAGVFLVHVEKVRHHRLHYWFAFVIRGHPDRTAKYLQRASVKYGFQQQMDNEKYDL